MEQSKQKNYQCPGSREYQLSGRVICASTESRETEASDMNYVTGSWFEE